eukprot:gnl/MRDRNA2_/MRDRNA2_96044_c0_seq1.p1 gnl/MRDRNA2_/MRDRNA2_96044_c0~~gnl/MRDRNA2_/MRDRNA2_96044_c0_seq1.p1  ORF type:complete len:259 (+),score=48.77 gnl/MRDRNA2_/MRDRNA2_96044_c0_seq1:35-778(+)
MVVAHEYLHDAPLSRSKGSRLCVDHSFSSASLTPPTSTFSRYVSFLFGEEVQQMTYLRHADTAQPLHPNSSANAFFGTATIVDVKHKKTSFEYPEWKDKSCIPEDCEKKTVFGRCSRLRPQCLAEKTHKKLECLCSGQGCDQAFGFADKINKRREGFINALTGYQMCLAKSKHWRTACARKSAWVGIQRRRYRSEVHAQQYGMLLQDLLKDAGATSQPPECGGGGESGGDEGEKGDEGDDKGDAEEE